MPTYSGTGRTYFFSHQESLSGLSRRSSRFSRTPLPRARENSQISGIWNRSERRLHISVLELKAAVLALHQWVSVLKGRQVMIATDNKTVVDYINKQGWTHSHTLLWLVVDLFLWLHAEDITIRARHLPDCLNVIADRLSRPNQPIMTEWRLPPPQIVNQIFRTWGTSAVDMFATVHNMQFPSLYLRFRSLEHWR